MYSTCLFCNASLGANAAVEHFPVGRRLAFDAAKGRLWAVCLRCQRWNLTPLEERWEAIEECERAFRDTPTRVSTDNVGLARLREGLELVRVGKPERTEFAAWRYGDQLGRRRTRALVRGAATVAAAGTVLVGAPLLLGVGLGALVAGELAIHSLWASRLKLGNVYVPHPDGGYMMLGPMQRSAVRLLARSPDAGGWGVEVPYQNVLPTASPHWLTAALAPNGGHQYVKLSGDEARRALGVVLPLLNSSGAPASHVREAVREIEAAGGPEQYFPAAASRVRDWGAEQMWGDTGAIGFLPKPVRLALEMAAHEEQERRAMEGELAALETAWREAEEIAAIADDLALPPTVGERLDALRRKPE